MYWLPREVAGLYRNTCDTESQCYMLVTFHPLEGIDIQSQHSSNHITIPGLNVLRSGVDQ